ncbi:hypothetical protein BJ912DRAFT_1131735 [Pholiota molesta]|nr:hypothetical protein BJ912DRAFT_1131735 [Pholiota molesta]
MTPALIAPRAQPRNGSNDHVMLEVESAAADRSFTSAANTYAQEPYQNGNGRYHPPQIYPDDFQSESADATSAYIHAYLHSPLPDAPILPTHHRQTVAPSPSPLLSAYGCFFPGALEQQSSAAEQVTRQWQAFAQNNQGNAANMEFTLSFRQRHFHPTSIIIGRKYLHTQRMVAAAMADTASIQSSRATSLFRYRSHRVSYPARRRIVVTRPSDARTAESRPRGLRARSPERRAPSSRLLERRRAPRERSIQTARSLVTTATDTTDVEDGAEGVDENEDEDYEGLLDLEYHPAFVGNISKRRRKWEVGPFKRFKPWIARQSNYGLLASPSYTTSSHSLRSHSIRRQPLANSTSMSQIRAGFTHVASQRRATRRDKSSLVDQLKLDGILCFFW